jgi:phycoerythrobilin:ferredoxin oxidoreductase
MRSPYALVWLIILQYTASFSTSRPRCAIPKESVFSSWYTECVGLLGSKDASLRKVVIPEEYGGIDGVGKVGFLGSAAGKKEIKFVSEAFRSDHFEYVRMVSFSGGGYDVFNLLVMPRLGSCLPIFGADIVCLPGGALAAIDFQPARADADAAGADESSYFESPVYAPYKATFGKWQDKLPSGGELPETARRYFSPYAIWTRVPPPLQGNPAMEDIRESLFECLKGYLELLDLDPGDPAHHSLTPQPAFLDEYLRYRIENDPAKNMLVGSFGKAWTEQVLESVLFPPYLQH